MTEIPRGVTVVQPRPITHVGVTVTDAEAAIDWYRRILGFQLLHGPVAYTAGEGYCGDPFGDIVEIYSHGTAHIWSTPARISKQESTG